VSSILDSILGGSGQQGGALPPDLAAAIQGAGQDAGSDQSQGGGDPVQLLSDALDTLQQYMQVEPDEEDKAVAAQCITQLQKLKAKDQAEADGAMQGKTTPRMVRKAAAAQGGPGGGY
jgi:hypothetical protein